MDTLMIQQDGTVLKNKKTVTQNPMAILGHHVTLDTSFTLSSFFAMLRQYPDLKAVSQFYDTFLDIIPDTDPALIQTPDITGLVFYKTVEITGFPGTPAINIYNNLKGRVGEELKDLKFFHIESLLGHTLSLGKLRHIVFGDKQDMFIFDTVYTLFELLEGIAWELSFNFNPLECSIRR